MRLEIIPHLTSLFNSQLPDSLSRTISLLEQEDLWMNEMVDAWLREHGRDGISAQQLRSTPPALARRLIRKMLRRSGSSLTDLSFDHVEAVRSLLADGKSGRTVQLPGGFFVTRGFDRLVFSPHQEATPEFAYELAIPGTVRVPELGLVFRARCITDEGGIEGFQEGPTRVLVDGGRLGSCVKIRSWKPGDYYKPAGWPSGKVKKLFQRARVPRSQRGRWPLVATESTVVWVTSFPVSREFLTGTRTKKIVAFEALEG